MQSSATRSGGVALVTGASRGIGKSVALRLASQGLSVAVNYHSSAREAEAVALAIRSQGVRAMTLQADMSSVTEAARAVTTVEERFGPLEVLVNNAGTTRDRLIVQMSEDDWDATWLLDLAGPRAAAHAAITLMMSRSCGRIVNIGSVVGSTGNAGQANYAAAKSAILGLTRELALLGAAQAVTVNCVIPGYVFTDATAHLTPQQRETWLQRIPMRHAGTEEDMAAAVEFLASPRAGYVTGQCLSVDGGLLAASGAGLAS